MPPLAQLASAVHPLGADVLALEVAEPVLGRVVPGRLDVAGVAGGGHVELPVQVSVGAAAGFAGDCAAGLWGRRLGFSGLGCVGGGSRGCLP